MEPEVVRVVVRTNDAGVVAMTPKFTVTSYGIADGVAILKMENGSEKKIPDALGIYKGPSEA